MKQITVLLADDNLIVREGVRALLARDPVRIQTDRALLAASAPVAKEEEVLAEDSGLLAA